MPQSASNRGTQGATFGSGAFVRVGVGLRQSCKHYPNSVLAINRFAQGILDGLTYTSFVILDHNQAEVHKDSQNAHLPNVVLPLSSFTGGEIVVRTGAGEVVLDVAQGPVSFCARAHDHYTRPFRGRRLVLVLFSLKGACHLSADDRACLSQLRHVPVTSKGCSQAPSLGSNSLQQQGPSEGPKPVASASSLQPSLSRQVPLLVEACAGSAILSSVAAKSGWAVVPVDQASCRFVPHTPLVVLDLRDPQSLDILLRFDEASPADWLHLGLPCGTCSRARERPLPGNQGARPLRGPDALFGLPGLRAFESEQVAAANEVYRAAVRLLFRAYQTGALVSIENPVRSWLWPLLASLIKSFGNAAFAEWYFSLQDYDFDACMFGSRRAKATRIKGTPGVFDGLQRSCDNSHPHLSWKPSLVAGRWQYPTKEEAEYAPQLCEFLCLRASDAVSKAAHRPAAKRAKLLRSEIRAAGLHQHVAMPPMIAEFRATMKYKDVPPNSDIKILHRADSSNAGVASDPSAKQRSSVRPDEVVGVYHTMEEHISIAQGLPCPGDCSHRLPDPLRKNLFLILTGPGGCVQDEVAGSA